MVDISVAGENDAFSQLATIMVFAELNNTVGDGKGIAVSLAASNESAHYTNRYNVKGVSIDGYLRVDLSSTTKVLLFDVRNTWHNGTVLWNLSDPGLENSTALANNESVLLIVAATYAQGDRTPTLHASSAGYDVSLRDHFAVRPVSIDLLTLRDGVVAVSEVRVENALGTPQDVTWQFDSGSANITSTASIDRSLLVFVQTDYLASKVHKTTATANSSSYSDSQSGVVIA